VSHDIAVVAFVAAAADAARMCHHCRRHLKAAAAPAASPPVPLLLLLGAHCFRRHLRRRLRLLTAFAALRLSQMTAKVAAPEIMAAAAVVSVELLVSEVHRCCQLLLVRQLAAWVNGCQAQKGQR
jgi:hypothetical protein